MSYLPGIEVVSSLGRQVEVTVASDDSPGVAVSRSPLPGRLRTGAALETLGPAFVTSIACVDPGNFALGLRREGPVTASTMLDPGTHERVISVRWTISSIVRSNSRMACVRYAHDHAVVRFTTHAAGRQS
jgi:hypothetical protein